MTFRDLELSRLKKKCVLRAKLELADRYIPDSLQTDALHTKYWKYGATKSGIERMIAEAKAAEQ